MTVVERGAFFCIRHLDRFFEFTRAFEVEDVRRASEHDLILLTIVQVEQSQLIRIGMRLHFADLRHDKFLLVPADAVGFELVLLAILVNRHGQADVKNLVHFHASESQLTGDILNRQSA